MDSGNASITSNGPPRAWGPVPTIPRAQTSGANQSYAWNTGAQGNTARGVGSRSRQPQSAPAPWTVPSGGNYAVPQEYRSVPNPMPQNPPGISRFGQYADLYGPQAPPEPLFVAVNPFEARRGWRTRPSRPQPTEDADLANAPTWNAPVFATPMFGRGPMAAPAQSVYNPWSNNAYPTTVPLIPPPQAPIEPQVVHAPSILRSRRSRSRSRSRGRSSRSHSQSRSHSPSPRHRRNSRPREEFSAGEAPPERDRRSRSRRRSRSSSHSRSRPHSPSRHRRHSRPRAELRVGQASPERDRPSQSRRRHSRSRSRSRSDSPPLRYPVPLEPSWYRRPPPDASPPAWRATPVILPDSGSRSRSPVPSWEQTTPVNPPTPASPELRRPTSMPSVGSAPARRHSEPHVITGSPTTMASSLGAYPSAILSSASLSIAPSSRQGYPSPVPRSSRSRFSPRARRRVEQSHRGSHSLPVETGYSLPFPVTSDSKREILSSALLTAMSFVAFVLFDAAPRQLYLHLLLRIPALYFSRVTRIFEDARLSLPDIKRMARAKADQWTGTNNFVWQVQAMFPDQQPLPASLLQFRTSWESFIDSLMREWKTLNIISVLLMSAILTMLQIEAASHPITRTSAVFSLICALMSLLYGCMYIIRFGTMRKMHKASSFANEAQKGTTSIWWNVWVLLAMPAIWLAWSIITFLTCIMSFVWLSGSSQDPLDFALSPRAALGTRIALTVVFSLGVIYFFLIVRTFHRYGDPLDREWMRTVAHWTREADPYQTYHGVPFNAPSLQRSRDLGTPRQPSRTQVEVPLFPVERGFTRISPSRPLTTRPSAFFKAADLTFPLPRVDPVTVMHLGNPDIEARRIYTVYENTQGPPAVAARDWDRFVLDVSSAWNGQISLAHPEAAASDTDLPAYNLVSPPRPENPMPTSTESEGKFVFQPSQNRSMNSSESSYGRPTGPSNYMNAAAAPDLPPPHEISNVGHDLKTFTKGLSSSPKQSRGESAEHSASQSPAREKTLPKSLSSSPTQSRGDSAEHNTSQPPAREQTSVNASHTLSPAGEQSYPAHSAQNVREFLYLWNERYFHPRNLNASLVLQRDSSDPEFVVTLDSWPPVPVENGERPHDNPPNLETVAEERSPSAAETSSEHSRSGTSGSFATADDPRVTMS